MNGGGTSAQNAEILTGTAGGTITLESSGSINLYGGTGNASSSKIRTLAATGEDYKHKHISLTLQGSTLATAQLLQQRYRHSQGT